ncbi:MAG TPA: NAD(P)H-hydrate dehydratase [Methylibium sp.]|nr:NAD(P)H-hydrate dehydratase [Methylibium sp.]
MGALPAAPLPIAAGLAAPRGGWPLHGAAASRRIEAASRATLPDHALMARAGVAVARLALAVAPAARRAWIAAGPGNNGGDGLEAAIHLQAAGKEVVVSLMSPTTPRPADAALALARAQAAGVRLTDAPTPAWALTGDDVAIDALLGIGVSRPPGGWLLDAVDSLHATQAGVLAVDLPSGLDADHGRCIDARHTVRADWTLALLTLKPGLFTADGRDHAGAVWFDDLGVAPDAEPAEARLLSALPCDWPSRFHAQHKGSFGDLWIVGGAAGMTGAAVLAARAGLAAGAGRVYLVGLAPDRPEAVSPELMQRPTSALASRTQPLEQATLVCGCGGGTSVAQYLPAVIGRASRLLLDADALNALAGDPRLAQLLRARHERGRPTVLTPHPLEAARLLGCTADAVQADRLGAARTLAARFGAMVVLKGSGSVIASPDGVCRINASGNAALASAGTGDVLAGWIGGLWAQGLDAATAAALGVFSHGAAADQWACRRGRVAPLTASRLIDQLVAGPRNALSVMHDEC